MTSNILLVVLDSVRAKNTSLHGYKRETTPFLEKFSENSTVYTQARAPSVSSNPSHASIFTGLSIEEHRLTDRTKKLNSKYTIFHEIAEQGYQTGLFSGNSFLTQANMGFAESFETVESGSEYRLPFPSALAPETLPNTGSKYRDYLLASIRHEKPVQSLWNGISQVIPRSINKFTPAQLSKKEIFGDTYTDLFFDWVLGTDGPWAACINYMDAHTPYLPKAEWNIWGKDRDIPREYEPPSWYYMDENADRSKLNELEDYYDSCIRQVDAEIERLVNRLKRYGLYDDTLLVITADHGEGFGEPSDARSQGTFGHGISGGVAEEVLHVPLLMKLPSQSVGKRIKEPASLQQFPTVVKHMLAGDVRTDAFVPDGPVVSYMEGMMPVVRPAAEPYVSDLSSYEPSARVIYEPANRGVTKYVLRGEEALKIECENAQTVKESTEIDTEFVRKKYPEFSPKQILETDTDQELSPATKRRLKELGYV